MAKAESVNTAALLAEINAAKLKIASALPELRKEVNSRLLKVLEMVETVTQHDPSTPTAAKLWAEPSFDEILAKLGLQATGSGNGKPAAAISGKRTRSAKVEDSRIIEFLEDEEKSIKQVAEHFDVGVQTMSKWLKTLEGKKTLSSRKDGLAIKFRVAKGK